MNSSDGVRALSRFVEWLLSFFQDTVSSLIEMLSGGQTGSALNWLMRSWKSLFMLFLLAGMVLNVVIYFARWRPHWWWLARRRPVVDDALLAKKKKTASSGKRIKPSTIVPKRQSASPKSGGDASDLFSDSADSLFGESEDGIMEVQKKQRRSR